MARHKRRIPPAAVAVLVCGAGCDDGGGAKGDRIAEVSRAVCKRVFRCYPDEAAEDYGSERACARESESDYEALRDEFDEACLEAALDYAECYVGIACDGDVEEECGAAFSRVERACPGLEDYESLASVPAFTPAAARAVRRIRTP